MSLETALENLTAQVTVNNALLEKVLAGKSPAPAETKKAEAKAEAEKPKPKQDASKVASVENVRKAFGDYLGVADKAERAARGVNVKAILNEVGGTRATEVPEENRAQAIAWITDFAEGRTPNFMADNDGGGEAGSLI